MGMQPTVWGPAAWVFFHSVMHNFPNNPTTETIVKYKKFLISFAEILPCPSCSKDFTGLVNVYITDDTWFTSKDKMIELGYKLHDDVNNKLEENYDITLTDLKNKYKKFEAGQSDTFSNVYNIKLNSASTYNDLLVVFVLIGLCALLFKFI